MSDYTNQSETFHCEFRPNKRSRRIKLSYRNDRGFLVSYPPKTSIRTVEKFVAENKEWMRSVVDRSQQTEAVPSLKEYLQENCFLHLNGVTKEVLFQNAGGLMTEFPEKIIFYPEISESQLQRKLQELAKRPLSEVLFQIANEKNLEVLKVQIRDQKSRWGSCSSRKSINLNWRLILMPQDLQNHIILHELAHLIHPNHSSRFWNLLKSWDPKFEANEALLQKSGNQWIRLGRI